MTFKPLHFETSEIVENNPINDMQSVKDLCEMHQVMKHVVWQRVKNITEVMTWTISNLILRQVLYPLGTNMLHIILHSEVKYLQKAW